MVINILESIIPEVTAVLLSTILVLLKSLLRSGSNWLSVTPFGIRKMMNWFKNNYNNIPVYITENGVSDRNATLYDWHRVHFYRLYISEVLKGN